MRLGSDPEIFLQDQTGKHISVIGLINADKWNPLQIPDMPKGFTLQEDNVALEYGVPPASSAQEFIQNIRSVMARSQAWLPGLQFSKLSATVFSDDQLDNPAAHVFGCEPDFDAWTGQMNPPPNSGIPNLRSAGGHVHIETDQSPYLIGQRCDLFLAVPATLMDTNPAALERRRLYGKRGAIRPKPYGVEYRTLSNFWIFEDKLIEWVWNSTKRAVEEKIDVSHLSERIIEAVNNNNKKVAEELVKEYSLEVF